jgi:hypothetical protein
VEAVTASEVLRDHCRESDLLHGKNLYGGLQHRYHVPFILRQILHTPLPTAPMKFRAIVETADSFCQRPNATCKSRREYIEALIPLARFRCPKSLFKEPEDEVKGIQRGDKLVCRSRIPEHFTCCERND